MLGRTRLRRYLLGLIAALCALAAAALLLLWLDRKPIARDAIDRMLAKRGVAARYRIAALGPQSQRLTGIVIGDPAHPDLTAESATVTLGWWITGPYVRAIAARGVRLEARVTPAGKLSLGSIDRLLPPPGKAPFALPDISLALDDARAHVATPAGQIALSLAGSGNLQDGFSGHFAAAASRLATAGCTLTQATAFLDISVKDRQPLLDGPLRAEALDCGERLQITAPWIALKARLAPALDRWSGAAGVAVGAAALGDTRLASARGTIDFNGSAQANEGHAKLSLAGVALGAAARAARSDLDGRFEIAGSNLGFDGRIGVRNASLNGARQPLLDQARALGPTPLGPIALALADAASRAADAFAGTARLGLQRRADGVHVKLRDASIASASGARASLAGGDVGFGIGPRGIDGAIGELTASVSGGGLPDVRLELAAAGGDAFNGALTIAPYAAGDARIAPGTIRLDGAGGTTRLSGTVALDGPLAGGRVAGLRMPVAATIGPGRRFVVNPRCSPLSADALTIAAMRFARPQLTLCPLGPAVAARTADGRWAGGVVIERARLAGAGSSGPVSVGAERIAYGLAQGALAIRGLSFRMGAADAQIRLDIPLLNATAQTNGIGGRFADGAGRIGRVPLLIDKASGRWTLQDGTLRLAGDLGVRDAATDAPRFRPLVGRDVLLSFVDGRIRATGTLAEPATGRAISKVAIVHDLGRGTGSATLDVNDLRFDGRLQPEAITPLTLGLIADVAGAIDGQTRIAWDARGVTSGGAFRTASLALAAPFGPVKGIAGTIRFTDLLGLVSAPHQQLTIAEVNPGIAVQDGKLSYQLLPDRLVRIEGARWPLSGGTLALEPTTLDFADKAVRRLTFRVTGLDAAKFIEQFKLDNIAATGTFDGVLPMQFTAEGGRIVDGHLVARAGGGRLSYVGQVSNAQLGTYGTLAFDALKSIRYQRLTIDLDGALDGEIVSRIGFTGINDRPAEARPAKGLARSFTNLPFKFNITVRAPFRGLLNSASDFVNPGALLTRDGAAQASAVQGQESGAMRSTP